MEQEKKLKTGSENNVTDLLLRILMFELNSVLSDWQETGRERCKLLRLFCNHPERTW